MAKKLTANQLKTLAILFMFFDHFIALFMSHDTEIGMILRVPGRLVAPIMCYMIAVGFHKTSNINKYLLRLFIFAVISHVPYNITFNYNFFQATSVMWGLFLGLLALTIIKKENLNFIIKLSSLGLCCMLAITANWNYVSVLWIVAFGIFYGNLKRQLLAFTFITVLFNIIPTFTNFGFTHDGFPHWYQLGVFLAIPLLMCYNEQKGKEIIKLGKYGFYLFYPLHLLCLYAINNFTSLDKLFIFLEVGK